MSTLIKLSQGIWTTTPKNFYHPNQLNKMRSLEFLIPVTLRLGVVVQTLNLANIKSTTPNKSFDLPTFKPL